ncbi:MAG: hypothetical protein IPL78_21345 [Chloroflexi bacterium]|nr:hypothetical protein [Chloroflexota bacterium]
MSFSQVTQIIITEGTMQIHYNGTSKELSTLHLSRIAIQQIPRPTLIQVDNSP